jgi:dephospho-CoA kinase
MEKLRIGLTGNVGSGKTAVTCFFKEKNIDVIDTDQIARVLTAEKAVKKTLVKHFSNNILLPNQTLNRKKLLQIIVENPEKKKWLENYLHPLILERMNQAIEQSKSPYVIIAVPLLFEGNYQSYFDRICLVHANEGLKIKRICQRDGMTPEFAKRLLDTQIPSEKNIGRADDIITNNGTIDELHEAVNRLHKRYLKECS